MKPGVAFFGSQIFRFLLAGGIAAAANYGSRFIYSRFYSYEVAIVCAYLTGMLIAFVLMRNHVFNSRDRALPLQAVTFSLVNILALIQTLAISIVLAQWVLPAMGVRENTEALAHLTGVAAPVVTSYLGHNLFTFRKTSC